MISKSILREIILEVLSKEPTPSFHRLCELVKDDLVKKGESFNRTEEELSQEIVWDLITERILNLGSDSANLNWPWLRVTDFGRRTITSEFPSYHNPDSYLNYILDNSPNIDSSLTQYIKEGLNCFKNNLIFGSAVMFGAAAEKLILILLESIINSETDSISKKKGQELFSQPNLPKIFDHIKTKIEKDITSKSLPYEVHQGCFPHLNSAFEMIRVQRNEAVHPKASKVEKEKVFLTIQTFPVVVKTTCKLVNYYKERQESSD